MLKSMKYYFLFPWLMSWAFAQESVPISTTRVMTRPLAVTTIIHGTLESPSVPMVSAEIAGRVTHLTINEGEAVESGQLLAKLDTEIYQINLENAQADLQRLHALIANQQTTLKRYQNLVARQSSAQSELDQAKTDLAVFLAELEKVKAHLKEIQYQLSKTQIFSPVTGLVQQRLISIGDYVQPGTALFQIVVTQQLQARLYLPETLVEQVQPGLAVQLESLGQTLKAKVTRLRPMLNAVSRALEILVEFDNAHHWKAGTSVTAKLILETHDHALLIPERSLVPRPGGQVVYLINQGRAQQRLVQTGARDGEWIEVLRGLVAGDPIALDGASFLTEGTLVKEGVQ